jgi:hypothetical protein
MDVASDSVMYPIKPNIVELGGIEDVSPLHKTLEIIRNRIPRIRRVAINLLSRKNDLILFKR